MARLLEAMEELGFQTKPAAMVEELIIEADRIQPRYWRDVWDYRQLFYFLAWRDILVRQLEKVCRYAYQAICFRDATPFGVRHCG